MRVGYADRKRNLEAVRAREREAWVDRRLVEVERDLCKLRGPFREFDAVREWENSFLTVNFRWKLLVLVADSASGKSSLAEALFSRPLVLTVEEAEHLDLRSFECDGHDGLVLDDLRNLQFLHANQESCKGRTIGHSLSSTRLGATLLAPWISTGCQLF